MQKRKRGEKSLRTENVEVFMRIRKNVYTFVKRN